MSQNLWMPLSEDFPVSNLLLFGLRCLVSHYINLTKTVLLECQMWFIIGHFKIVKNIYTPSYATNSLRCEWTLSLRILFIFDIGSCLGLVFNRPF